MLIARCTFCTGHFRMSSPACKAFGVRSCNRLDESALDESPALDESACVSPAKTVAPAAAADTDKNSSHTRPLLAAPYAAALVGVVATHRCPCPPPQIQTPKINCRAPTLPKRLERTTDLTREAAVRRPFNMPPDSVPAPLSLAAPR